jgi:hypothetical protein
VSVFLVTVKLARQPGHDPTNKQVGKCPVDPRAWCDDVTGEHHTLLYETDDSSVTTTKVRAAFEVDYHVTRVERSLWDRDEGLAP